MASRPIVHACVKHFGSSFRQIRNCARQIRVIDQLEAAFAAPLTRRRVRSVLRIVDKGLDCFRRWKLQKCNKGGIKRLALQRLYVPAACQVLASVFVHNVVTEAAYSGTQPLSVTLMSAIK